MKPKRCKACGGTGNAPDWKAVGASVRKRRESFGLSLRYVASRVKCSAMMLSDLERGQRAWTGPAAKRVEKFLDGYTP